MDRFEIVRLTEDAFRVLFHSTTTGASFSIVLSEEDLRTMSTQFALSADEPMPEPIEEEVEEIEHEDA